MKETTPAAMPPCFEKWCQRFDEAFTHKAQKRGFRHPPRGIIGGKREKKPVSDGRKCYRSGIPSIAPLFNADRRGVIPRSMNFDAWIMNKCSQTRISQGFSLIIDDSGHRKSGNFTDGVVRQYIGEIGKTDNGIVVVTTHLYDGRS